MVRNGFKCIRCLPCWSQGWMGAVACCLCPASGEYVPHVTNVGKDQNSNRQLQFPLNAYGLHTTMKSKNPKSGTSLVVQRLRICLPIQGTRVWSLVQEDPTCRRATKPMCHKYWACMLQLLKPVHLEPMLRNKRSHHNEKPTHCNEE